MLIKVFCVVSMLSKLPPAVCLRGGGGGGGGGQQACLIKEGGATGFLWNFHRYRLVCIIIAVLSVGGGGGGGGHHSQHIPTVHINELHCSIVVL